MTISLCFFGCFNLFAGASRVNNEDFNCQCLWGCEINTQISQFPSSLCLGPVEPPSPRVFLAYRQCKGNPSWHGFNRLTPDQPMASRGFCLLFASTCRHIQTNPTLPHYNHSNRQSQFHQEPITHFTFVSTEHLRSRALFVPLRDIAQWDDLSDSEHMVSGCPVLPGWEENTV